jgi:hypothetical protein
MFDIPDNLVEIIDYEDRPQAIDQTSKTEEIRRRAEEDMARAAERRRKNRKGKGSTKTPTRQPRDLEGLREDANRAREQQRFDTLKGDRAGQRNQMILALTQMYADGRLSREDVRSAFKASGLGRKYDPKEPNRESFGQQMQKRARGRLAGQLENMFGVGAGETRGMGIVQLRERMKQEIADKNLREKNRIRARKGLPPLSGEGEPFDSQPYGGGPSSPLADAPSAGANPRGVNRGPDTIPDNRPAPLSPPQQQGPRNFGPPEADFSGQSPEEVIASIIDDPASAAPRLDPAEALRDSMNFGPIPPDPQQTRAAGVPDLLQRPAPEIFSPRDLPRAQGAAAPAAQGDGLTPSQRLSQRMTTREEFEAGRTRVAPGAVGSAPTQPGGPATGQPSRGFALETQNGMFVPTEAARQAERYYRGETSGEPLGTPVSGLDRIRQDFKSGQAAQREMMSGITDQFPMMQERSQPQSTDATAPVQYDMQQSPMGQNPQVKEQLEKLRTQNQALAEQDRLEAEAEKRRKLEERMMERRRKMQENRQTPVSTGIPAAFDENIRQPMRRFFGIGG